MQIVSMYKTDDGKTFGCRDDARRHEIELEGVEKLSKILRTSITTGRVESICRQILMEAQNIQQVLSTFRKKLPKTLAQEAA